MSNQGVPRHSRSGPLGLLNGPYHRTALNLFMVVVLAHWAEHLVQAVPDLGARLAAAAGARASSG